MALRLLYLIIRDIRVVLTAPQAPRMNANHGTVGGQRTPRTPSVTLCAAERRHAIVTTDPDDLTKVNLNLELITIPGLARDTPRRSRRKRKI